MCFHSPKPPSLPPPPPPPPEPPRDVVTPRTQGKQKRRTLSGAPGQNRTLLTDELTPSGGTGKTLLGN